MTTHRTDNLPRTFPVAAQESQSIVSRIRSPEGEQANDEMTHARGTVSVQRAFFVAAVLAFVALCLAPTRSATIALFKGRCFPEPRLPSGSTAEHVGQFRTRLSSVKFGREVSITPFYKFDRTARVKLYPA